MDAWVGSCLLVVSEERIDYMWKAGFLKSLLMNPQGGNLLQVNFCNLLIALKLNEIDFNDLKFFQSLKNFILYEYY